MPAIKKIRKLDINRPEVLNVMRLLTREISADGAIVCLPDAVLKSITDLRFEGDTLEYTMRVKCDPSKFAFVYGSAK